MVKRNNFTKDARVSGRIRKKDKDLLDNSDLTVRDCILFTLNDYYDRNPQKKASVLTQIYNKKLEDLKKMECNIQTEIGVIEKKIKKLTLAGVTGQDVSVDLVEKSLDSNVQQGINIIQNVYNRKRELYASTNKSDYECIDDFLSDFNGLVNSTWDEHAASNCSFDEFKEVLFSEIEV